MCAFANNTQSTKSQTPNSKENIVNWNLGFVFWNFSYSSKSTIYESVILEYNYQGTLK